MRAMHVYLFVFFAVSGIAALDARAGENSPLYKRAFRELDTDGNKHISEREFVGTKEGEAKAKARRLFQEFDRNDDKQLSRKEYDKLSRDVPGVPPIR